MPDEDVLAELLTTVDAHLSDADALLAAHYPGDRGVRQPLHTVYVPANRCTAEVIDSWSRGALLALETHGSDVLLEALGLTSPSDDLVQRVTRKLTDQPIEDLRIDFEDGYRPSAKDDEDSDAAAAVAVIRTVSQLPTGPAHIGIRFKSLEATTRERGLRTLDIVVRGLAATGGLPDGFVVTLPKVTSVAQVEAMVETCEVLERAYGLDPHTLLFELQIETPQSILGSDGRATVAPMIHAAGGRCTGVHYGTYDYATAAGIAPAYQSMEHPVADHAKATMHVAVAGTGVFMSDGSTNVLPVGATRRGPGGLGPPRATGPPLVGARDLPGLGSPPGTARHSLRRGVRVHGRGPADDHPTTDELPVGRRLGRDGRAGDGQGAGPVHPASTRLRSRNTGVPRGGRGSRRRDPRSSREAPHRPGCGPRIGP